jgi:hypothetical protein
MVEIADKPPTSSTNDSKQAGIGVVQSVVLRLLTLLYFKPLSHCATILYNTA